MRITVRQLKGLIREAVREVIVKQIHENDGGSTQGDKAELISKWKGSGESNGMSDLEWAHLMYLTGIAMKTGDESELKVNQLTIKRQQKKYPGFKAQDFIEVAEDVHPDASDPHGIRD